MCGNLSRESIKKDWKNEKTYWATDWSHTSCWPCHDPIFITPSWFSVPHGLSLPKRSRPDCWRNELLYRANGKCEDGTSECKTYSPLLRNTMTWPFQSLKNTCWARRIRQPLSQYHSERKFVRTETVRYVLTATRCANVCLCSDVVIAHHLKPHPRIVWPVWWLNGSHCMNGSSFSPSQRTFHFKSSCAKSFESLEVDKWALLSSE